MLLHEDATTPMVCVNTLVGVGSRDEDPEKTGFAHLFEHLMFGGTPRVPSYDAVAENAGGESNAFTCCDYTDYHLTLPAQNLETALTLESDRLRGLLFEERSLEVQQRVVTEEYHQRYLNQPYGDVWLLLRPLCYKSSHYRWCTIGSDMRHVQQATTDDVRAFYAKYYVPNNAILCVAGNMRSEETLEMVERLYGDIPAGEPVAHPMHQEEEQTEERRLEARRRVPADALLMAYPMPGRLDKDFAACNLLNDILGNGDSSRLVRRLVKESRLMTELDLYLTGERDGGLFVIEGKMSQGACCADAERAIGEELQALQRHAVEERELQKVKNKYESIFRLSQYKALDRAMELCYYEWLGHAEWINDEPRLYGQVTPDDLQRVAHNLFRPERRNILNYLKDEQEAE